MADRLGRCGGARLGRVRRGARRRRACRRPLRRPAGPDRDPGCQRRSVDGPSARDRAAPGRHERRRRRRPRGCAGCVHAAGRRVPPGRPARRRRGSRPAAQRDLAPGDAVGVRVDRRPTADARRRGVVSTRAALLVAAGGLLLGTAAFAREPASRAWRPALEHAASRGALAAPGMRTLTIVSDGRGRRVRGRRGRRRDGPGRRRRAAPRALGRGIAARRSGRDATRRRCADAGRARRRAGGARGRPSGARACRRERDGARRPARGRRRGNRTDLRDRVRHGRRRRPGGHPH